MSLLWATTAAQEGRTVFMSPDYKIYWETPRDRMRERCFDFQAFLINLAQVKLQTGSAENPSGAEQIQCFVTQLLYHAVFSGQFNVPQNKLCINTPAAEREILISQVGVSLVLGRRGGKQGVWL